MQSQEIPETWNHTLNEKRPPLPPSLPDNNPKQYCVSCGVKLMSMFPFIERYITAAADRPLVTVSVQFDCAPPIIPGQPGRGRGVNSH